ncbi:MAG TPA: alpha/beta hydrolase-fold protein [Candidatus Saccharimonadales bacterium]|nr:alpha/beta hydrolase-fold protein [Candidatus Saccharimonadales bacterium]
MNINLFGQTVLISICTLGIGLTVFLATRIRQLYLMQALGIALLLALTIQSATAEITTSPDELPTLFLLIVLPFALSLCLPWALWQNRRHGKKIPRKRLWKSRFIYVTSVVNVLTCLLLGVLLINGYFRYYPTPASFLGVDDAGSLNPNGQVVLQYKATNHTPTPSQTLESYLYGQASNVPTDGKLYSLVIPGTTSKFHTRPGWVYIPAIAATDTGALKLPVLVLLSGYPGSPNDWLNGVGLLTTLNSFAKVHHGITPLVFVVDTTGSQLNDTECVNSPHGNVETYLAKDVPDYIQSHFPVSENPINWAVGGISMGGMCSVMLTLLHSNTYHYFVNISGEIGPDIGGQAQTTQALFGGSTTAWQAHQSELLLQAHTYSGLGGYLGSGRNDSPDIIFAKRQIYAEAKQAGLDVVLESVDGHHSFDVFSQIFKDSLPWVSNRVGATICSGSTTCN